MGWSSVCAPKWRLLRAFEALGRFSNEPGPPSAQTVIPPLPGARAAVDTDQLSFDEVYETHVTFVIRSIAALGVPPSQVDDAAQEVFLVIHRKLASFEGRAALRTWIYGIVVFVARAFRRTAHQRHLGNALDVFPLAEVLASPRGTTEEVERADGLRRLARVLASLDDEKREVLVLAELEELPVTEIAEALGENVNTVYSRLRVARHEFAAALERERAKERRA